MVLSAVSFLMNLLTFMQETSSTPVFGSAATFGEDKGFGGFSGTSGRTPASATEAADDQTGEPSADLCLSYALLYLHLHLRLLIEHKTSSFNHTKIMLAFAKVSAHLWCMPACDKPTNLLLITSDQLK